MTTDAGYIVQDRPAVARMLHLMGQWDQALAVLSTDALSQRAEILVDRHFWRLDGAEAAEEAVRALRPSDPVLAGHLEAQLRYARVLFDLDPRPDDLGRAREDFAAAAADARLAGWGTFWLGVLADNVEGDARTARSAFRQSLEHAREQGDALLESYAVRHIGAHVVEEDRAQGILQLRRSYQLRAALGARPQTAAAALTLAGELPPGAEADQLREAAGLTARELELTWLLRAL